MSETTTVTRSLVSAPLPQIIDILQDMWEAEGMYDGQPGW